MVDNARYQKLYETSSTTIVEDRSAVIERDKLKRELDIAQNSANRSSAFMDAVCKKANINYSFDSADSAQRVISWINTLQTQVNQLEADLEKKDEELLALRRQVIVKPSTDDAAHSLEEEGDRTVHGGNAEEVDGGADGG